MQHSKMQHSKKQNSKMQHSKMQNSNDEFCVILVVWRLPLGWLTATCCCQRFGWLTAN